MPKIGGSEFWFSFCILIFTFATANGNVRDVSYPEGGNNIVPPFALMRLERSYWVNATLSDDTRKGYWGIGFPSARVPTVHEIKNAEGVLTGFYGANRLYLLFNHEISDENAEKVFRYWKRFAPSTVELVPTLLLRMYDSAQTPVFTPAELLSLTRFLRKNINPKHLAIYDVYPNRNQAKWLSILSAVYPKGLIRVGLQPGEAIHPPFVRAVQDTWSGLCTGKTNAEWESLSGGADTLRKWVIDRNKQGDRVAWDLVTVAWDYRATKDGSYPGYDDANKNDPLPAGRNLLAAKSVLTTSKALAGFSSDLFILEVNSLSPSHDGGSHSFYSALREGKPYCGYYHEPLDEIASIYNNLARGISPKPSIDRAAHQAK